MRSRRTWNRQTRRHQRTLARGRRPRHHRSVRSQGSRNLSAAAAAAAGCGSTSLRFRLRLNRFSLFLLPPELLPAREEFGAARTASETPSGSVSSARYAATSASCGSPSSAREYQLRASDVFAAAACDVAEVTEHDEVFGIESERLLKYDSASSMRPRRTAPVRRRRGRSCGPAAARGAPDRSRSPARDHRPFDTRWRAARNIAADFRGISASARRSEVNSASK